MSSPARSLRLRSYAAAGHRSVDGWLEPVAVRLVRRLDAGQRERDVRGHVAEIGVHHGRLLVLLALLRRPDEHALAVDLFEDQHLNVDGSGLGDRRALERNLRRWDPRAAEVRLVQADSSELDAGQLRALAGGGVRLVSVDGGHTAALTEHDLETACGALVPGGAVVLDDVFNGLFPGVAEGARAFFRASAAHAPVVAAGNKTVVCRTADVEHLTETLRGTPGASWRRTELWGRSVLVPR